MTRKQLIEKENNSINSTNNCMRELINDPQTTCELIEKKYIPGNIFTLNYFDVNYSNNYFISLYSMKIGYEKLKCIDYISLTIGGQNIWSIKFDLVSQLSNYVSSKNQLYFPKQLLFNNDFHEFIPVTLMKYHDIKLFIKFIDSTFDIDICFIKLNYENTNLFPVQSGLISNNQIYFYKFFINQYNNICHYMQSPIKFKFYLSACRGLYVIASNLNKATLINGNDNKKCIVKNIGIHNYQKMQYIKLLSKSKLPDDVIRYMSDYFMSDLYYIQFEKNNELMYFPEDPAIIVFDKPIDNILAFVSINILVCRGGMGGKAFYEN